MFFFFFKKRSNYNVDDILIKMWKSMLFSMNSPIHIKHDRKMKMWELNIGLSGSYKRIVSLFNNI